MQQNHPGRNPFKGTNYQTLAALALFLQHLRNPTFSYIQMETPRSVDFTLVFADGHKVICEAKDWKGGLRDRNLKDIVRKLNENEKETVGAADEILVICSLCLTRTFEKIETLRFWPQEVLENELAKQGYERELGTLLSKLRLWQQTKDVLEDLVYSLFSQAIGFWLPQEDIEEIVRSILLKAFHWGSAEGNVYSRKDIEREIQSQASRAKGRSTIFNERLTSYGKQIDKLDAAVKEGNLKAGQSEIIALSQDHALMYFLLNKLKARNNITLADWMNVWQACKTYYPLQLFDIFRANIATKENRKFILSFIESSLDQLNTFYFDTYFESGLAELLTTIVQKDYSLNRTVLRILEKQYQKYDRELFYLTAHEEKLYRESELSDTLQSLYYNSNNRIKEQIHEFILNTFNLIEDEDDYNRYTPREIFRILKQYLNDNDNIFFEHRFLEITRKLATQYERFYRYKFNIDFKGWDKIGNTSAFYEYEYKVSEKQFIRDTLIPAVQDLDGKVRWTLLKEHCIIEPEDVSKYRPDFLNRVAIPFVLDEYKSGNPETLQILRRFLLSQGIPDKAELIYQDLIHGDFTDDQKWNLVAITIDKFGSSSPFVEKIVGDLANNGHEKAIEQLIEWSRDPAYYAKPPFFGSYLIPTIKELLDSSPRVAVSLFEKLINNPYFVQGSRFFDAREVSELLSGMIVINIEDGWRIWNELNQKNDLTANQQQLLTGCLLAISDGDNREALERAFVTADDITSNYEEFLSKFFDPYARQLVVQLLVKCAARAHFDPIRCFKVVRRFINDPDPSNDNDASDPTGKINYHKQILEGESSIIITSVRGLIPWAIREVVRVGIEERLDDVIEFTGDLTRDKNLYVRLQSRVTLTRLAQTRLSTTNDDQRFMSAKNAKQIENIAFEMLDDPENKRVALQGAMADVFNQMRSIDYKRATKAVNYFVEADFEALRVYLSTIIYFAEFAQNFDRLQKLTFRDTLFHLIERDSETKTAIAWQMQKLSKAKSSAGKSYLNKTFRYVHKLVEKYDHEAFRNVYSLIKEHISNVTYQTELVAIYKKCIETEFEFLSTQPENQHKIREPYFWNNKILGIIFDVSKEDFLCIFKILSQYPLKCHIGDVRNIVDLLFDIPTSQQTDVEDIFENLVRRDLSLYEKKKQWEEKVKQ